MNVLCAVPVDIGRDDAAEAARMELSRPEYADAHPSVVERILDWLAAHLDLAGLGAASAPLGVLVIVLLIVVVAIIVRLRLGATLRSHARDAPVFADPVQSAAGYREAAEEAARRGDHAAAVRERFRAIARSMEERGVLEPRPGRTADEVAVDAAAQLPAHRAGLAEAATLFDDVHYGDRRADADTYARLVEIDATVSGARTDT